jgi:hypothetical protein
MDSTLEQCGAREVRPQSPVPPHGPGRAVPGVRVSQHGLLALHIPPGPVSGILGWLWRLCLRLCLSRSCLCSCPAPVCACRTDCGWILAILHNSLFLVGLYGSLPCRQEYKMLKIPQSTCPEWLARNRELRLVYLCSNRFCTLRCWQTLHISSPTILLVCSSCSRTRICFQALQASHGAGLQPCQSPKQLN